MGAKQSKERKLYEAVRQLDIDAIRSLRAEGASLNWISPSGKTALILACSASFYLRAVILLIEMGADVNFYHPGSQVGTALNRAAGRGVEQTAILLLSHGANPLYKDCLGRNSLDVARTGGHTNIVRAIEDNICFFSGWLLVNATLYGSPSSSVEWAVVIPRDNSLSSGAAGLNIALYSDKQSSRPLRVVSRERFTFRRADFRGPNAELIFTHNSSGAELKLLSTCPEDRTKLSLLYDTNPATKRAAAGDRRHRRPEMGGIGGRRRAALAAEDGRRRRPEMWMPPWSPPGYHGGSHLATTSALDHR
ncbi:putative E3 ubiquitin-protein ligase XBOS34 isoform X2 [Wolffia australiana]